MFRIQRHEVPIEIRALRTANVYEVTGRKHLMVDSGMSDSSYRELINQKTTFNNLDVLFLTHLHIDHIGGAHRIQQEFGVQVAMGEDDVKRVNDIREGPEDFRDMLLDFMKQNGTPPAIISEMIQHHSVLDHLETYLKLEVDIKLKGGEEIVPGARVFHNPGHSPGSCSLFLEECGCIFTGDHILPGITPNISFYDQDTDMLGLYLRSLGETRRLHARTVYPGHRDPFENANARIDQIIRHHEERMNEISGITDQWKTAYEVAEQMKWSRNRSISAMNLMEMNFAIGEAISHLMHMEAVGMVEKREDNGIIVYRKV